MVARHEEKSDFIFQVSLILTAVKILYLGRFKPETSAF